MIIGFVRCSVRKQLKIGMTMMEDVPILPLFYDEVLRFVNKRVDGLGSNPTNLLDLRRVRVK